MNEISTFLAYFYCRFAVEKTKSHFTAKNFTFKNKLIGMEDHQEIIRYTNKKNVVDFFHLKIQI